MATRTLRAINPKKAKPKKPKILIYGKPGAGKTWSSLEFPNVYYIDTEGGASLDHYTDKLEKSGGVYFGPEQGSLDFETILEEIQTLATVEHPYKTLVIDSISKVFNTEITKEAERLAYAGKKNEFGIDKKPAIAYMKRLVSWLQRIDMNVILVSHEKAEWKQGEQIGETFDAWDKLEYELDLCLNIVKIGPKRFMKVRKSRLEGFPDGAVMPWSYKDFAGAYGQDIIEKKSKKLVLATPEQVKEIMGLLNTVNLPPNWLSKALTKANAASIAEVDSEEIVKMIAHIKKSYLNIVELQSKN